jgi:cytochrome c oxidase cbb3-type subunit II
MNDRTQRRPDDRADTADGKRRRSRGDRAAVLPAFADQPIDRQGNPLDIKPYDAVQLAGRDIYVREGCYNCHSQMIRPFRAETERYGHYSVAGEFIYDRPFQWGSKRTGPDLHRVGGRYSDEWHRVHLINPRDGAGIEHAGIPVAGASRSCGQHRDEDARIARTGASVLDEEIAGARAALEGKTEMDALIAYLQDQAGNRGRGR